MIIRKKNSRPIISRDRTGATAVEFALVCPLVFIMIFAMLQLSRAATVTDTVKTCVIAGNREATVAQTTADKVKAEMNKYLSIFGVNGGAITVTPETIDNSVNQVQIDIRVPLNHENGLFMLNKTVEFSHVIQR